MKIKSILVVDDSSVELEIVTLACSTLDCNVVSASCPEKAFALYKEKEFALVLTDYVMDPFDGIDLISKIKEYDENAKCLLMTGYADARVNNFISDSGLPPLITKPIRPNNLAEQIRVALNSHRGATFSLDRVAISNRMDRCVALLGQSVEICQARKQVFEYSSSSKPIFLEGPFGVGKPDVARFIHAVGPHAESKLVACDCGDIDESEMQEKIIARDGQYGSILEEAKDGTLIFNHIDEIPIELQTVLAHRMGELSEHCHVLAWANDSLDSLLESGSISEELYFEFSLHSIHLPALSERPTDIEEIVRYVASLPQEFDLAREMKTTEVDYLVATLRKAELDSNLRELVQRVRLASFVDDCVGQEDLLSQYTG